MSVTTRGHVFASAATAAHIVGRCDQNSGDTVFVMAAGGNRVTFVNDTYRQVDYATGQEAQGWAAVDNAEWGEADESWQLNFDGGDPHAMLMVAVEKGCEFDFTSHRAGSVGASLPEEFVTLDLAVETGELLVILAFARGSTELPTSAFGEPTYSDVVGGSAMAAWIVEPWDWWNVQVGMPAGRSGHYIGAATFWKNPALEDTSTEDPGEVWAILKASQAAVAVGSYFDSVEYVEGIPGVDPTTTGHTRLMGELITDHVDDGTVAPLRWIVTATEQGPLGDDASYTNDQGFGQALTGPRGRAQLYAPYSFSGDWPLLQLLESAEHPGTEGGFIDYDDTVPDHEGRPTATGVQILEFRLYIYKPVRDLLAPAITGELVATRARFSGT